MNDNRASKLHQMRQMGHFTFIPTHDDVDSFEKSEYKYDALDATTRERPSLVLHQDVSLTTTWMRNAETSQPYGLQREGHIDFRSGEYESPKRTKKRVNSAYCSSPTTACSNDESSLSRDDDDNNIDPRSKRQREWTRDGSLVSKFLTMVESDLLPDFSSFEFPTDLDHVEPLVIEPTPLLVQSSSSSSEQAPLPFNEQPLCDIDCDLLKALLKTSSKSILTPGENDIIFGRGKSANTHPGNIRYRELVEKNKPLYHALGRSNTKKKAFTLKLLQTIKDYGGRFLELDDVKTGEYCEVSDDKAREKISQRLREPTRPSSR